MLENRASSPMTCSEISSLLANCPSASHTNTCVLVENLSTNTVTVYTIIEVLLTFDVSVQSVIIGTQKVAAGHTYSFAVVPKTEIKKAGPINAVTSNSFKTTATSKPLFIYMYVGNVLTLVYKFDAINIVGPSLGFHKHYASRVIADHKG